MSDQIRYQIGERKQEKATNKADIIDAAQNDEDDPLIITSLLSAMPIAVVVLVVAGCASPDGRLPLQARTRSALRTAAREGFSHRRARRIILHGPSREQEKPPATVRRALRLRPFCVHEPRRRDGYGH